MLDGIFSIQEKMLFFNLAHSHSQVTNIFSENNLNSVNNSSITFSYTQLATEFCFILFLVFGQTSVLQRAYAPSSAAATQLSGVQDAAWGGARRQCFGARWRRLVSWEHRTCRDEAMKTCASICCCWATLSSVESNAR
jgi:hypothetical protein